MSANLSDLTKSIAFYGFALSLMIATALLYPMLGDLAVVVAMLTPLIAVLLMLLVVTRDGWSKAGWVSLGLHRLGFRGWLPAVLIPLAVLGTAYLLVWSTGLAAVGLSGEIAGIGPWLLPALALFLILKHLITGALSEEIGWRGYLLPRLVAVAGPAWALPLAGLMQAVWHLPFILLTPLYHSGGAWWIVLPLFLVGATAVGVISGYLRLATGSVWPSAILHAAHNVFWALLRMSTVASPLVAEYIVGESGILPIAGYTLAVAVIVAIVRSKAQRALPVAA